MNTQANIATIGDNNPPSEAEIFQKNLADRNAAVLAATESLLASAAHAPQSCTDEDTAKKITTQIKLMTANIKLLDSTREVEKAPYLAAGNAVQSFFKERMETMTAAKAKVLKPLDLYTQKKAEDARAEARAEADRLAAIAADELAAAAKLETSGSEFAESTMAQALITEAAATKATASAATPAGHGKVVSSGGTASVRTEWKAVSFDRATLDLNALRDLIPDTALQQALNAFVRAGNRTIRGAEIKEVSTTTVR